MSNIDLITSCILNILTEGAICTVHELHVRVCEELRDRDIHSSGIASVVRALVAEQRIACDVQEVDGAPRRFHALPGVVHLHPRAVTMLVVLRSRQCSLRWLAEVLGEDPEATAGLVTQLVGLAVVTVSHEDVVRLSAGGVAWLRARGAGVTV